MRSFLSSMTAAALAAVLVILSAAGLAAQSSTGSMRGTVKDSQGGAVPGATVAAVCRGAEAETVTDQTGKLVAVFRGHSTQIKGELVPGLTPDAS